MMRSVSRRWRWLLTALLAALLLPLAGADSIGSFRNENLALVESFCVTADIAANSWSAEERDSLEQEIVDTLSDDAVLYDLPLVAFCYSAPDKAEVIFTALVLDNGMRYDLLVLFLGVDAGALLEPTIYSLGGVMTFPHDQAQVAEELLDIASEQFRDFALDWKEAQ